MLDTALAPTRSARSLRITHELDDERKRGALRQIVIPPCPDLLLQLQAAMATTEPDLQAVARIAGSDVAMAATLLRNANGPLNAVGPPLQTVGQAMNRLGLDQTYAVLTGFLARHHIPVNHPQMRGFWAESAQRAAALHFMAKQMPGMAADLAQLYGLFCHVGLPVLLQSLRGYTGTLAEARARIDRPFVATENANHRTDHAVVGALVARAWHLPASVMAAIRLHHDLASLGSADTEAEIHTLVAAGLVADHVIRDRDGLAADVDWLQHGSSALAWLQISHDDLADWRTPMQEVLDAV
jgi:HD-like signal output (HDOD) protein